MELQTGTNGADRDGARKGETVEMEDSEKKQKMEMGSLLETRNLWGEIFLGLLLCH